jgi:hypothetical protein
MPSSFSNKSFAESFLARHRSKLYAEERIDVEKTLGKGAIKFKIAEGGIRAVFAAHMPAEQSAASPRKLRE